MIRNVSNGFVTNHYYHRTVNILKKFSSNFKIKLSKFHIDYIKKNFQINDQKCFKETCNQL